MTTGRDRKNSIKALFGEALTPAPETKSMPAADVSPAAGQAHQAPSGQTETNAAPARSASGAVKAMGLSLSSIAREAEEARQLRQALEEGERVISLDTARVDASFISDRLSQGEVNDPQFIELVESMRESGQQVPILVRPHPDDEGRYQVAYGHRRMRAAQSLGIEVKALVRALSADELVLAQGKENAERRNLSFIERAVFAQTLVTRGFDRKLIGDALSVQKSELSRLIQVAEGIPEHIVRAIGPAPKAGRDRWMKLVELYARPAGNEKAQDEIKVAAFKEAETDRRFEQLFARLARNTGAHKPEPDQLLAPGGRVFAAYKRQGRAVKIDFAKDVEQAFIDALSAHVSEAYAAHLKAKETGK